MIRRALCLALLLLSSWVCADLTKRPDVRQFMQEMHVRHGFAMEDLDFWFSRIKPNMQVLWLMHRPAEKKGLKSYYDLLITPTRIEKGRRFIERHRADILEAARRHALDPAIITAILGIETTYGEHQGNIPVMEALATLTFEENGRNAFFRKELEAFLLVTRHSKLKPLTIQGSYAGAIGIPQFMPSNIPKFGCSRGYFSRSVDLQHEVFDGLCSAARYLHAHGWKQGAPVVLPLHGVAQKAEAWLSSPLKSEAYPLEHWQSLGIAPQKLNVPPSFFREKARLLSIPSDEGPQYLLAFKNFDVIMTYNKSPNYAMAVWRLAESLAPSLEYKKKRPR